ncbi:MAG: S9 family peptidase [Allomuricauda sp.]
MKKVVWITLILCSLITDAISQENTLIPRELFFNHDDDRKEFFRLNPEGNKVFYFKNIYRLGNDLFEFDVVSKKETKHTFNDGITEFYVFSSGKLLLNFRTPSSQYFGLYDIESKALSKLQPFPMERAKIYDVNARTNEAVAIVIGKENQKSIVRFNMDNEFEEIRKPEGFTELFFDENLNIVAGEKINESQGKSFYYLKNNEWTLFSEVPGNTDMTIRGVNNILSVSHDGTKVYYADNTASDITQLVAYDIEKGQRSVLLSPEKADIIPTSIIFDTTGKPQSVVSLYGRPIRYTLPNSGIEDDISLLKKQINELHFLDADSTNTIWLVENMTGGANEYYLYNRSQKKLDFLFNDYPVLDTYPKNHRSSFEISSFDGLKLPVNVYIREDLDADRNGVPDKPLPTVLYVHGGPWIGWQNNNWLITRNLHLLANRGYAVIYTDFRGAVSYGKTFIEKSNNQWGDGMVKDKKAIAEWAVDKGIAAEGKVGIFGWSYGGYAAMAGLAFAPDTYACGIAMYGISDLESFLQTDFASDSNWKKRVANIDTEEGLALAKAHSPINFIRQIKAPLLLSTGGKDQRIETKQSDLMADKMVEAGKKVTYLYYPEEGHDYRNPNSWISFWSYAEEFLSDYLGGSYLPKEATEHHPTFEVRELIENNRDAILGQWSSPSEMTFEIIKTNDRYVATVTDPGKVQILKKGAVLFNVTYESGDYVGEYTQFFDNGTTRAAPCQLELSNNVLKTNYKATYTKMN